MANESFFLHATFTVFWLNIAFIAVHSGERCGRWASGLIIMIPRVCGGQWNRLSGYLKIIKGYFSSVLHKNICCDIALVRRF